MLYVLFICKVQSQVRRFFTWMCIPVGMWTIVNVAWSEA